MSFSRSDLLRRSDVLSGSIQGQRRAARVVGTLEARVLHMKEETRRAIDSYFFGSAAEYHRRVDRGYLASVLTRTKAEADVSIKDFEQFAAQWRSLVPVDTLTRAELLRRFAERFGDALASAPATLEALGGTTAEVLQAYEGAFGSPLALPDSPPPLSERSLDPRDQADWRRVPGGVTVYSEGDPPDALYLVVNGHLRLMGDSAGVNTRVWEYGRGDVAGEAEVLTDEPRMARLVAVRDTELIRVPKAAVLALALERPETLFRMNRALVDRLRGAAARPGAARRAHTFALLPAHEGAPVAELARGLAEALSRLGSTSRIDRRALDAHLPEGPGFDEEAYEAEVITWLSERENEHTYIVAEGDGDPASEWSQRCLRQGDQLVLVADADASPGGSFLDQFANAPGDPPDLLLVHNAGTARPRNTRAWLRAINPRFVYHWRRGDDDQAAHIARRLTGRAVAVVLSGGAARGYAHIGVMQALAERGIPVDLIGGTSMGAMVGGGFALGRDAETMRRQAIATASRRKLLDPTLPLSAFTAGGKVTRLLKRETEGERIENLWRPYFCVSSNLTRASEHVHTDGSLWHAIRASIAIPGIFPPVLAANGDVLVDGGSVNNFPIDIVRRREDVATIIAVNVAPARDRSEDFNFGPTISGWSTLFQRLRPSQPRAPGLFSTVMRANEIRGAALMRSPAFTGLADLVIEPPVEQFPLLQFSLCRPIIQCGYESAVTELDAWLANSGSSLLEGLGLAKEKR